MFIEILKENDDKALCRERVFRDRSEVIDILTDSELIGRYRFSRRVNLKLADDVKDYIQPQTLKSHAIPAHIQIIFGCDLTEEILNDADKASHQLNSYKIS